MLLAAIALRLFAAGWVHNRLLTVWNRDFVIEGDAGGYWELGRKLVDGEEYSLYDPPRQVHRMPGFSAMLAVSIGLFGPNRLPARLLLAVVGALACGLVYLLGRELFDKKVGLMAAGFASAAPVMVGFSVLILSETLFALCLLGSLYALAKLIGTGETAAERLRAIGLSLASGAMIAVACYVRPSWLLAAPFFSAGLLLTADNKQQALVRGLLLMTATFVVLFPWAYRNQRKTGHWVFTTLWVGPSLYDGLNPQATGDSDMKFYETDIRNRNMSEYEIDRHYRRLAWQFVTENPGRTLQLAWLKGIRYWKPWPNAAQFDHVGYRLGTLLFFVPLVLLAIFGCSASRQWFWPCALTLGPILYFFAIHLVFVGSLRYRLPAEYPLCVLSAAGLQSLLSRLRRTPAEIESAAS